MSATLIPGTKIANNMLVEAKETIQQLGQAPGLAVVIVGDDEASQIYVAHKHRACKEVGIQSHVIHLPTHTTTAEILEKIYSLNKDAKIHGILVQLPLPKPIDTQMVIQAISPKKDVDGFHPINMGKLALGQAQLRPCTPLGVMYLLRHYQVQLQGLDVLIVGASNIVGKPLALELINAEATVTLCHKYSHNLAEKISRADCVISAVGKPHFIKGHWLKDGAIVIDIGISRSSGKVVGDIEPETAKNRARLLTPVPGGVGPITVATLIHNTILAYQNAK